MRHLQGWRIARPMDTRVERAKDLLTEQEGPKSWSEKIARVLTGWMLRCTCIAGCGTASQLSRFEGGPLL